MTIVQPRPASTVMLLRDKDTSSLLGHRSELEVFMVRRSVQSEFMPDIYVFPGGSVMPDDKQVESLTDLCEPVPSSQSDPEGRTALGTGVRAAAIRELFEEANVLLAHREGQMLEVSGDIVPQFAAYRAAFNARKGSLVEMARAEHLVLATDGLAYFAHWITPEAMPKRYDTHFFLAAAPLQQEALYDNFETSDGVWINPTNALKQFEQNAFPIAFPTFHQLRDLSAYANVEEALNATKTRYVVTHLPVVEIQNGTGKIHLPEEPDFIWKQSVR